MNRNWIPRFFLCYFLFICLSIFGLQDGRAESNPIDIVVFDKTHANWDHPAETNITIPADVLDNGFVTIEAYCDRDDIYLRAIYFCIDNRGGWIGTSAMSVGQTRGDTLSGGETVLYEYDLSATQFANDVTWEGSVTYDFIDQTQGSVGYLTPGNHTVKSFVSSQDKYQGSTQDSWISVALKFNTSDTNSSDSTTYIFIIVIVTGVTIVVIIIMIENRKKSAERLTNEIPYRPPY